MQLAILTAGNGWHVRDLIRAATASETKVICLDFRRITGGVTAGMEIPWSVEAVLVRTMPPGTLEQIVFRMDVLHRCQANGIPVYNSPRSLETCIDKYLTTAKLAAAGLPVPDTWSGQDAELALEAFDQLGGDVVVKPLFGSEGRGMFRIQQRELAWRVFRTLERLGAVLYLQRYVEHYGYDIRAFVLGGEAIAAMRRYARWDFRTNVAQGGQPEAVMLTDVQTRLAVQAAAAVGAEIAGVDLLPGRDGQLYVLEVNAVPGWRALAQVSQRDIAAEILRYIRTRVTSAPRERQGFDGDRSSPGGNQQ